MKEIKKTLILLSFFTWIFGIAQVTAFKSGEKLSYSVSYQGTGVSSDVMQINMKVSTVNTKAGKMTKLYGDAVTYTNFDRVFKIRDYFISLVHPNSLRPLIHTRKKNEGGHIKEEYIKFNSSGTSAGIKTVRKGTINNPNAVNKTSNTNISINPQIKDVLGSLYYLRAQALNRLKQGNKLGLPIIFDGKVKKIYVRYDGKKTINSVLGNKSCYKFSTSAKGEKNAFSGTLYLTADANKIPVLIEANIPVGKGQIKLKSASGLRN